MTATPAVTRLAGPPLLPSERRTVAATPVAAVAAPERADPAPADPAAASPAVPADTVDRRTAGEKQRAALIGSNLGTACVAQAGQLTVLRPAAPADGQTAPASPTQDACVAVAPALAGAVAATDQQAVAPGTAGAVQAVERVQDSTVTPQTAGLIEQGNTAVVVSGKYGEAVDSLADTIAVGRDRFLARHPELRAMQQRLVAELNHRMGGGTLDLDTIMRIADRALAREVLKANGITEQSGDISGERTIAMLSREQRMAAMPNIVQQIAENRSLLTPEARAFLQERFPEFMSQVGVLREIGRTVRDLSEREEIARMIEDGTIPLNASLDEIQRIVQQMRSRGVQELRSAGAYTPAERNSSLRRMEREIPRRVEITPEEVLVIGRRVAANYAEQGIGRPTYRDPRSGIVYALTREAAASYAGGTSASTSGDQGVVDGPAVVRYAAAARERLERMMAELIDRGQHTGLTRLEVETAMLHRYLGEQQVRTNMVTSAANLGDASVVGTAGLHARAVSRFA